ncbi:MAG TPA: RNA methyltransferase [Enhygromyxa sp.]|nr:RNA methyltransferase [Enhygromyxa sp.]
MLDDPRLEPYRALRPGPGRFIVEGALAVERLLGSGIEVESIVCTPRQRGRLVVPDGVPVIELRKPQIAELAGFDFHRGVLACAKRPATRVGLSEEQRSRLCGRERLRIVVAEQLADPRNLGAVVRNVAAFSGDLLVVDARGADPYSRLAIRAGVGNVFRMPIVVSDDLPRTVAELSRELRAEVIAATPQGAVELGHFRVPKRLVLLVGNEGAGLSEPLLELAAHRVRIPVAAESDSINVAAATAVLLYAFAARG